MLFVNFVLSVTLYLLAQLFHLGLVRLVADDCHYCHAKTQAYHKVYHFPPPFSLCSNLSAISTAMLMASSIATYFAGRRPPLCLADALASS
jgi:hypothetical protein